MPVHIVTDSAAAIPAETLRDLDMDVVSLFVSDGERTEADVDIDLPSFYVRLADMAHIPTTSQPSLESLVAAFRSAVQRGCEVVGVFISTQMSGTVETAHIAADMVREEMPGAEIEIVDSRSNSLQEGFAAIAAAKVAQGGGAAAKCVEAAIATTKRTRYLFTPHTLEYLKKGGRIGAASALLGSLLQIRPILTVENGVTTTFSKVRTQTKALSEMARQFGDDIKAFGLRNVAVHYIADKEAAEVFARDAIAPLVGHEVLVTPVSAVIGVHVGPAVAVVYETERELRA